MERNTKSPQIQRVDPDEPIAIIGIGCRFPGGAASPASFWKLLTEEVDAISEVPDSRWKLEDYYDPKPQRGKTYAKWGGFLDRVDLFDAAYFGITPREAQAMDPQQRLLLETAVEAIDDAGQTPEHFRGRRTGVFVGLWGSDYEDFLFNDPSGMDFYRTQGTGRYTAAGRLSFTLGLDGPSMAVDTACSSSLVTVHLACQSLRERGCEMALAGGVNLLLQPQITIAYSQSRMMAKDGRCRFGDADGSGYVRAEGAGLILLKPLADALADGDSIYAVVRGSAVNNDARTSGSFGTPGVRGQEAMLRQAYRTAGVDPREVRYVEAHGTGTKRGDPVEVRALANVLCENRPEDDTLLIGSVKTNVGHMEAAAGIGGLVKTALVLDRGQVPSSLHFKKPNPNIPWDRLPIKVPTGLTQLPADAQVHFAAVNSFGIGGTNAHVVMEEAPAPLRDAADDSTGRYLLNLTARSPEALQALAATYAEFLQQRDDLPLADVCYTLSARRSLHSHRLSVAGHDRDELITQLQAYLNEEEQPGVVAGEDVVRYERAPDRRVAFVYSGQGSQWIGMGRELLEREPVFRTIIEECDRNIKALAGWSLIEELQKDEAASRLGDIDVMWPAIFSMQAALTEFLKSCGLRPSAVVGHSIGEAAAAWASGSISLADAVRVIVAQGKLVHETSGQGGMALIGLPFDEAQLEVEKYGEKLVAAIEASPKSTVLSGDIQALDEVVQSLEGRDIMARKVKTPAAVHCALMDPLKDRLLAELKDLALQSAAIPFYSATLGMAYDGHRLNADYWWQNIRRPVLFKSAVDAIVDDHVDAFLEVSPHAIVERSIDECLAEHQAKGVAASTLRAESDEAAALERAVSKLAAGGVQIDLERFRKDSTLNPLRLRGGRPRVAFVFSGQGPQWYAMGRELFEREPVYRAKLEEIDALLQKAQKQAGHGAWSLLDELNKDESASRIMDTEIAQPAIFALQVGLAELWQSWGVTPDAITGHSVGEVAAAHVSGKLSLADAVTVIYHRGRLMQEATGLGKMAAVQLTLEACEQYLKGYEGRVEIGVANSPGSSVLSGETAALEEILVKIEKDGIYQKMLPNNYAFHSPQMEPFKEKMNAEMVKLGIQAQPSQTPIVSTVSGKLAGDDDYGAEYWGRNIRGSVLFVTAIDVLIDAGYDLFLEIGPHPVLSGYVNECLERAEVKGHAVATLNRKLPEHLHLLGNLGKLFTLGYCIDWERYFGGRGRVQRLPAYAWQRERFWIDPPKRSTALTGSAEGEQAFRRRPDVAVPAFEAVIEEGSKFLSYKVTDLPMLPSLGIVDAILSAGSVLLPAGRSLRLTGVEFSRAIPVLDGSAQIQAVFQPTGDSTHRVLVCDAGTNGAWTAAVSGDFTSAAASPSPVNVDELASGLPREIDADEIYETLSAQAYEPGDAFRCIDHLRAGTGAGLAYLNAEKIRAQDAADNAGPEALEAALQVVNFLCLTDEHGAGVFLPHAAAEIVIYDRTKLPENVSVRVIDSSLAEVSVEVNVLAAGGAVLSELQLQLKFSGRVPLLKSLERGLREWLYELSWREAPRPGGKSSGISEGTLLVFADAQGVGREIPDGLPASVEVRFVAAGDTYGVKDQTITLNPQDPGDFERVLEEFDPAGAAYLWALDMKGPDWRTQQAAGLGGLLHLAQAMERTAKEFPLAVVTRGAQPVHDASRVIAPEQATLWGCASVLEKEYPGFHCLRLDLDPGDANPGRTVAAEIVAGSAGRIGYQGSRRFAQFLEYGQLDRAATGSTATVSDAEPQVLDISERGILDNLYMRPAHRVHPQPGEVEIQVEVTGLNFRDVLLAMDMYAGETAPFGVECAGRITAVGEDVEDLSVGDEVLALCPRAGFATFTTTPADLVVRKPAGLSFEDAATIPAVFLTCYYSLHHLARIRKGDRVLIHSAAGGIGLAAVQLAKLAGAEIYATCGTDEKREYLRGLGIEHIFSSRDFDFVERIADMGGVDVILNSLSGEFIPKNISLLRDGGRYLEIGKKDILSAKEVHRIKKKVSYFVIDLMEIAADQPDLVQSMLLHLVEDFQAGHLKALPFTSFSGAEVRDAFRFMARGKHIGKIVVQNDAPAASGAAFAGLRKDASYLITGGLGDLGLLFAQHLAVQGAGHVVLTGRRQASAEVRAKLDAIEAETGAKLVTLQGDVSKESELAKLLEEIDTNLPVLRGVLHLAGVIDDGMLRQMNWERFERVLEAKVGGTSNLHRLTAQRPLDFFVMFSSIASMLGLRGQSNYSAANAYMDALAHHRRSLGLPGQSVHWGPWAEIGMVADIEDQLLRAGLDPIPPSIGLTAMQRILESRSATEVGVYHMHWPRFLEQFSGNVPAFFEDFASGAGGGAAAAEAPSANIVSELKGAPPPARRRMLFDHVRGQLARILGLAPGKLDPTRGFKEMGMDSLMTVELRNRLQASLEWYSAVHAGLRLSDGGSPDGLYPGRSPGIRRSRSGGSSGTSAVVGSGTAGGTESRAGVRVRGEAGSCAGDFSRGSGIVRPRSVCRQCRRGRHGLGPRRPFRRGRPRGVVRILS